MGTDTRMHSVFASIQAGNIFNFVPDVSSSTRAAEALTTLMEEKLEIDPEDDSGKPIATTDGAISFRNVHFRYESRPEVRVLRGLNITVKPGQFAAIVGPSGSGKSTTIQLICRFYDPLTGTVELDGQNVADLNVAQYRSYISLVSARKRNLTQHTLLLTSHYHNRCLKSRPCTVAQ